MDTDWPANDKDAEGNDVEPIIISIYFSLVLVNILLDPLNLMLVEMSLSLLH